MAARSISRSLIAMVAITALAGTAAGQVVLEMPPPPRPASETATAVDATQTDASTVVTIGDVALYRYSSTRYTPRWDGPRFYQQHQWYSLYPPYSFFGVVGTRFLAPPVKFQLRRPFHRKGFRHKFVH